MSSNLLHLALLVLPGTYAATIYVSPTGTSNAPGTISSPLASIQSAIDLAVPGDTIYLRGGTYKPTRNLQITKSGTAAARITLSAYGSEVPIIDGESLPYTPAAVGGSIPRADRGILHIENAAYWNVIGIELANGPYGVYAESASNNLFERLVTRENYETGFQLQGSSAGNRILWLDSFGNRDPRKNGESADGIAIKEGQGEGNIIRGARLWGNVDDGLDFWEFKSKITVQDTLSWGNGFNHWSFPDFAGDGNGFKLGGGDAADKGPADHNITNCFAFQNAAKGFTDNKQTGNFVLARNTAWKNGQDGFQITTAGATLTGNLAAGNKGSTGNSAQVSLTGSVKQSGNSWSASATWTDTSFKSVNVALVQGKRGADGKIAASDFLIPASGSAVGATTKWA